MGEKTNILHTARLKNNCPTCFQTDGLEFTFSQTEKENAFVHKPNPKIEESLYCHNCRNNIYPVNWTEDIERVYDYNKKLAETNKQYLTIKPLVYILIVLAIVIVAGLLYIFLF